MASPHSPLDRTARARLWLLVAITAILSGWALRATGPFMVPVVFSIFLALIIAPLDRRVAGMVPDKVGWLGHVAAMGTVLAALLVFVGLIWVAAEQVVQRFPTPEDGGPLLPQFGQEVSGAGRADSDAAESAAPSPGPGLQPDGVLRRINTLFSGVGLSFAERLGDWVSAIARQILSAVGALLSAVVLVFFLTLIMLTEAPKWRQKIISTLDDAPREKALNSVGIIADRLRRYLLVRTILGALTAVLYVGWLWLFGVELLVVWGLLAFLLNFIPTFGSLVAGVLPVIFVFMQKDFGSALLVGAGILLIEQVMGNFVDPRVQGRQVSVSSLVVLVTLLIWGWIWGIAGAVLAVPITIAAMIVCAHVQTLRPFALMLSDARDFPELDRQAGIAAPLTDP